MNNTNYLRKILSDLPTEKPFFELFDLYKVWYEGNEFEKALKIARRSYSTTKGEFEHYGNLEISTWNLSEFLSEVKELSEKGYWVTLSSLLYGAEFPGFKKAIESYINDPDNLADYHTSLKEQAGCDRYHARREG